MIQYLGSKLKLIPRIVQAFEQEGHGGSLSLLELFSGSARLSYALKVRGHRVVMNDMNLAPSVLARGFVEADRDPWIGPAQWVIRELRQAPPVDGWFTETYARQARFFQPKNAVRIEGVRRRIAEMALPPVLEAIALASLLEASSRVDSTCGIQSAYVKTWSARSCNDLDLRVPHLLPCPPRGPCLALRGDAEEVALRLAAEGEVFDLAYLDPPYNVHNYSSVYHLWDTLCAGTEPEVFGVARKPVVARSEFNAKPLAEDALRRVIEVVQARVIVVSFSDDGYVSREAVTRLLQARGEVRTVSQDHVRYIGRKIGGHNPDGDLVGEESAHDTVENLFICRVDR